MRGKRRLLVILFLVWALAGLAVQAAPPAQTNEFEQELLNIRFDMEILASTVLGDERPDGWTGNLVLSSSTYVADLWFDNELLANEIFEDSRPSGWIGATSSNAALVARNVRHDLEIAALSVYTSFDNFPADWSGGPPLYRCTRSLMNLVFILEYDVQTPDNFPNYCQAVAGEIDTVVVSFRENNTDILERLPELILSIRGDLERIADEVLGLNNRPPGWIWVGANRNLDSPTLLGDAFLDMGLLADNQLGPGERPAEWIGSLANSDLLTYRNLRHDIELLADAILGANVRPTGWQGVDILERCDPNTQNLVIVVQNNFTLAIDTTITDRQTYCFQAASAANQLAENPPIEVIEAEQETRYLAESRNAFAYLDPAALEYMGVMPWGTGFRAWYRNFGESTMMFVSGEGFAVFIDRRWTTMDENRFRTLPTLEGIRPLTFCDAFWCNGPAPTPTPTGAGPLDAIINAATPPATLNPSDVSQTKQQVSWNNIRVTYVQHIPDRGVAQVTLDICNDVAQVSCEQVISVFDNGTGLARPVVSQFNGRNVYEFPYGYTTNLLIEGQTLFSTDIWLNDPSLLTPVP